MKRKKQNNALSGKNKRPNHGKEKPNRGKSSNIAHNVKHGKVTKFGKKYNADKSKSNISGGQQKTNNYDKRKFKSKDDGSDTENLEFEEAVAQISVKPPGEVVFEEEDSGDEAKATRKFLAQQNRKKKKSGGFQSMGLSYQIFKGVMNKGYQIPSPIQRKTIPTIMDGKDVVAMARTGSGKTAAFLIPMLEKLKGHSTAGARAVILSPTRELALQTLKFTKELGRYMDLRAAVILGGDSMAEQFAALHENPDIIIATPGRFMHVAVEMDLRLNCVEYVVFDEADRLFEMGFAEQIDETLRRLPESRQTLLFSATLPRVLVDFAKAGLHDPTLIRLDVDSKISPQLKTSYLQCRSEDKTAMLLHLLQRVILPQEQTVVFLATKHHCEYLAMVLELAGISCSYTYSALDQTARKIQVAKFRNRKSRVLLVTDLAARGIDIPLLDNVINYNFPARPKLFVHRVGRVARAGRSGVAYSLVSPDEFPYVIDLHMFLGHPLKLAGSGKYKTDEDGVLGGVPQTVIDNQDENLHRWHEKTDLKAMKGVIDHALKNYIKSRPNPSNASIKRMKGDDHVQVQLHPLFDMDATTEEKERADLINSMRSYRPPTTIFEVNSTKTASGFEIMKQQRAKHGRTIESVRYQAKERQTKFQECATEAAMELQSTSTKAEIDDAFTAVFAPGTGLSKSARKKARKTGAKDKDPKAGAKDEEFYVSYKPKDFEAERGLSLGSGFEQQAAGAVMDLHGDEAAHQKKTSNSLKWDRKKKKFVKDPGNLPSNKKIKTESGAWIQKSYKSNIYNDWLEKNKVAEQDDSDEEGAKSRSKFQRGYKGRGPGKGLGRGQGKGPGRGPGGGQNEKMPRGKGAKKGRNEIKRPEQILKQRKIKAQRLSFQKHQEEKKNKRRK